MDEVCSVQLLTSVRRMVLTLTQQNDESKMFVRFFHKQLGGILQVWQEPNTHFFAFSQCQRSVVEAPPLPLFPHLLVAGLPQQVCGPNPEGLRRRPPGGDLGDPLQRAGLLPLDAGAGQQQRPRLNRQTQEQEDKRADG